MRLSLQADELFTADYMLHFTSGRAKLLSLTIPIIPKRHNWSKGKEKNYQLQQGDEKRHISYALK